MMQVSPVVWDQLVAAYEAADAEEAAAYALYGDADPSAEGFEQLEARYKELDRIRDERQAKLLGVQAPTVAAAAYQLKVYALTFQQVDVAGAPAPDEDREHAALRRIYEGLHRLAGG